MTTHPTYAPHVLPATTHSYLARSAESLAEADVPFAGALIKRERDLAIVKDARKGGRRWR